MNRHDRELLQKQLHAAYIAPRHQDVMMAAIVAVFLAGVAVGGFLYAHTGHPGSMHLASNAATHFARQSTRFAEQ